jgi:hypothetical protein
MSRVTGPGRVTLVANVTLRAGGGMVGPAVYVSCGRTILLCEESPEWIARSM